MHDFSFKIFSLTVPKSFVGEYFGVPENFGLRKILCIREGGGGIKFFRRKFFVSQCRKFPQGESFSVSLISGTEKVWIRGRWGSIKFFRRKFFVSQCRKFPQGESFSVSLISGIKKFYTSEGYVTIFDFLSFFCLTVPKNLVAEPFCAVFQKVSGSGKFYG